MRKSEAIADPESCWNKAKDDEMVFVLLGRDTSSTAAVQAWITDRLIKGKNVFTDDQITSAMEWIDTVEKELMAKEVEYWTNAQSPKAGD